MSTNDNGPTTPRTRNLGGGFVLEHAHPGVGEPDWLEAFCDLQAAAMRCAAELVRLPDVTGEEFDREAVERKFVVDIAMSLKRAVGPNPKAKRRKP